MGRLIDADQLEDVVTKLNEQGFDITRYEFKRIELVLFEFPTIDAEPVVRCKDCRFYDPLDANRPYDCLYMDSIFGDDYCSRGEKLPEPIIYPQVEGITPTVVKIDEVTE